MDNEQLHEYCRTWVEWCRTRKYYTVPMPKNILARLQQSPSGPMPNGINDPDMQFFNMAIHTLVDMGQYDDEFVCFYFCYIEGRRGVKREADRLKISRATYYNRINAFARRVCSMSNSLKVAHEAMKNSNNQIDKIQD